MQQIKSTGLRIGVSQNWSVSRKNQPIKSNKFSFWWLKVVMQNALAKKNCFLLSVDTKIDPNVSTRTVQLNVLFYKYIQRSRLSYTMRSFHLLKTGRYPRKPLFFYLKRAQNYNLKVAKVIKLQRLLNTVGYTNYSITFSNIFNFCIPLKPYKMQGILFYYKFKRFSKLLYMADSIQIIYLTSLMMTSKLLADLLTKGIARNRRSHRQFLFLIHTLLRNSRNFNENTLVVSRNWRFMLFGKIGGQMRRKISLINYPRVKFNFQTLLLKTDYTFRCVVTKYGIFGIKVWVQYPLAGAYKRLDSYLKYGSKSVLEKLETIDGRNQAEQEIFCRRSKKN